MSSGVLGRVCVRSWVRRSISSFPRLALACCGGAVGVYGATEAEVSDSDLPREWRPLELEAYWRVRPVASAWRTLEILWHLGPVAVKVGLEQLGCGAFSVQGGLSEGERRRRLAAEVREGLTSLGPAFIKLGQALSIRPDVVPAEALTELRKLCDSVPAVPTVEALSTIEAELGRPVRCLFLDLDETTTPYAAASLGQVYRCRLASAPESVVAVKVQRGDAVASVSLDLVLLRRWAHLVEAVKARVSKQRPYDVELVDAFGRGAWGELDYRREANNQMAMSAALQACGSRRLRTEVVVPDVANDLTTRKVITTAWVEGDQLCRAPPHVVGRLVPLGVELFMWQLLDLGEFHCDP